ncbi:hypothetical protein A2716_02910 [candidate division WWE3 bacterium RIFCSPHIGHO2_01_FULL_40_23]|uniref:DUF5050 domain-containing protein n=1 Tax=candidate division WWE3 bacterium RIFCSPLOWO2_01_FULL_41_18 TaxID=1802625 RepID=A0A1F4VDK7_UNCKA|nr:MAG: hypothetical protein A2716_02910 [candidate division WWE3 bacterium RIFCSPHIGHO2_01_FULL_40_23]OGC54763.1 MAG: hypothetical protein A3A78_05105 [candidate division WWE3 bacterium RIFCSPLOWO2_01_FULL_41_18]
MKKMKFFKSWGAPLIISILAFGLIRPSFAQAVAGSGPEEIISFLASNNVPAGSETILENQQVYYEYKGNKNFITEGRNNSRMAFSKGEFITYVKDINGPGQIFLYNIPSQTTVQVTNFSSNQKPKVSKEGVVVWEKWIDDTWQIFVFDGTSISQITTGDPAINPEIEGNNIVFARKDKLTGEWRAEWYSLITGELRSIGRGLSAKFPRFENGSLVLGINTEASESDIPLSDGSESTESAIPTLPPEIEELIRDIEISTPSASPVETSEAPETVTEEEIRNELEEVPVLTEPEGAGAGTTETPVISESSVDESSSPTTP